MVTQQSTSLKEGLWVEKYRPRTLDDIVLPEKLRQKVKLWISNPTNNMPHLILIGPPGSGKTSLAYVLIHSIIGDESDFLYINGSSERGLQTIKETVSEFMRFEPTSLSPVKILFIDEADNLTQDSFKALRSVIENYQSYVRVIMTGNYDTFPEAIQSRCTVIRLEALPPDIALQRLKYILESENVAYEEEHVKLLLDKFYPDMRKCISYMQILSHSNVLNIQLLDEILDERDVLVNILCDYYKARSVTEEESLLLKIFEMLKKLNVTPYLCISSMRDSYRKLTSLNSGPNSLPSSYVVNLSILISRYSGYLKQCPLPEGVFIEFLYKVKSLKRFSLEMVRCGEIGGDSHVTYRCS